MRAQSHHKNSNRHGQQPIGPFTLRASGTDGEVFIRSIKGWLERGLPRLLTLFDQGDQPYAFLHPSSCKPFTVASFCSYFKKHIYRVSNCDISPGKLRSAAFDQQLYPYDIVPAHCTCRAYDTATGARRHIFVMERMRPDAVDGPANEGAATVCPINAVPAVDQICG